MSIFSLKPTRAEKQYEQGEIIADIDAIDVKAVPFRFNGKIHELKPISTKEFLKTSEIFAKMDALQKKKSDLKEIVEVYSDLIGTVCDTITADDVMNMTQAQVGALIQLVMDHVLGRIQKKSPVSSQS